MTMIVCSECGRAVSNKAAACIGCGAPIDSRTDLDAMARRGPDKPVTLKGLRRDLTLSSCTLLLGFIAAIAVDRVPGADRSWSLVAALLLIAGISWTLVTLVRLWSFEK